MPAPTAHDDYPAITDVKGWMTDAKMILPSDGTIQVKLNQAIGLFETAIGRRLIAQQVTFSLPCRRQYKVALPRSCYSITSVTLLGTALVAGQDYDAMSVDGNPPYDWLEFTVPLPGWYSNNGPTQWGRRGLVVVAMDGLGTTVPDLAWSGIISWTCLLSVPEIASAVSLGRDRIDEGQIKEYFAIRGAGGPYSNEATYWTTTVNQAVQAFKRVHVGAGG